jgi:hypothetical protein
MLTYIRFTLRRWFDLPIAPHSVILSDGSERIRNWRAGYGD